MGAGEHTLSEKELRSLQLVLLEMLLELDRICKKNNIRYAIIAGTLLGAVRHKGFIPWDDDIDVAMTRDEYIRFRKACESDLDSEKFFFQDHTTDPHYRWGYGRIRRKGSEFVRVGQMHMKMKTGIFLDVFPMDNVPNSHVQQVYHDAHCFVLRKLLYAEVGMVSSTNAAIRMIYRLLYCISPGFVFNRLEKLADKWNSRNTDMARIYTFPTPKGTHGYYRKWYTQLCAHEFEGHVFPGAADYDGYLTYKFGEYMKLPPPEERHWHPAAKFSLPDD